jgi:hypothetical protein
MRFSFAVFALLWSAAANAQDVTMSAKVFASLLPRISCDSIRLTRGPDDSTGANPDPKTCIAILAKTQASRKQFWPDVSDKDTADTYISVASKQAAALCKALLQENVALVSGACTFDEANANSPIYQAIVDQFARGLVPDGAARGSICTGWPTKDNAYVFQPILAKGKTSGNWQEFSKELAAEGFVDSFGQANSKTRYVWGISFEAGAEPAQLIAPQWFTIYNGPKSLGFALVHHCQTEGGQACADLQNLRNLGPDQGLCLETGNIGQ